jgi:hypothetical protein
MSLSTSVGPTTCVPTTVPVDPTTSVPTTAPVDTESLSSNVLVIAKDSDNARTASAGLNGYGVPFTTLLVPRNGTDLPALNSSAGGNFGGIVVVSEVTYEYGDSFHSALTDDQWNQLFAYQLSHGVRMVQYSVYPGPKFGASAVGDGCCDEGVDQLMSFTETSDFSNAGLRKGATVSTEGLLHYPATVNDSATTKEIAQFDGNSVYSGKTTAAVINNFGGRQQMVFFIGFSPDWSTTSNYLQHAWITWVTRGLYAGYRRVNLNTQIDDMFLQSSIYKPSGRYRVTPADMDGIASWLPSINAKMNPGSKYFVEAGHNGNGNIKAATANHGWDTCNGGAIQYDAPPSTPLDFRKPLGTGTDVWPETPKSYNWTTECTQLDDLLVWWKDPENRDKFAHISHTFTHLNENNATYSDIHKEISFNQAWMQQNGISSAKYFSEGGLIPPAITGLHNGDALQAWWDRGITNCVGDSTRQALLNQQNEMWPYFTTFESDGFDGMQVNPRWSTRIYYNCDTVYCLVQEWIDTSPKTNATWEGLLNAEKQKTMRQLLGLRHDGYMFHQANLRNTGIDPVTVNGKTEKISIFQAWVEKQVQEFVRLVDWPLVTTTHKKVCITGPYVVISKLTPPPDVSRFP